jgi:RNA polymerase sigma-70 factor, ECF subfamily
MISTKLDSRTDTRAAARYGIRTDEGELVARIRAQDQAACRELVCRYGGRMTAITRRFFRCEHDRDDALQDALVSAFRGIDRYTESSSLSTWLHRITVNACLMKRRRRCREVSIDALPEPVSDAPDTASAEGTALARLERSELCDLVRRHVMHLPQQHRAVLWLRDIEQMEAQEAARLLGCSAGALKVRLHRARQTLRSTMVKLDGSMAGGARGDEWSVERGNDPSHPHQHHVRGQAGSVTRPRAN